MRHGCQLNPLARIGTVLGVRTKRFYDEGEARGMKKADRSLEVVSARLEGAEGCDEDFMGELFRRMGESGKPIWG